MTDFWFQFLLALDSTLRVATPLIFCAMAGIFSERSGIIDISLEGKMLMAAFVAAATAYATGSPWIGAIAAIIVSILASLIPWFCMYSSQRKPSNIWTCDKHFGFRSYCYYWYCFI